MAPEEREKPFFPNARNLHEVGKALVEWRPAHPHTEIGIEFGDEATWLLNRAGSNERFESRLCRGIARKNTRGH